VNALRIAEVMSRSCCAGSVADLEKGFERTAKLLPGGPARRVGSPAAVRR
jgi:hypothetical protein